MSEYTNKLNQWPAKHNRTGTDFMKYYPIESKIQFPFKTKEYFDDNNTI